MGSVTRMQPFFAEWGKRTIHAPEGPCEWVIWQIMTCCYTEHRQLTPNALGGFILHALTKYGGVNQARAVVLAGEMIDKAEKEVPAGATLLAWVSFIIKNFPRVA